MKQTSIDKINKVYTAIKDSEEFKMYAELLKDVIRAEAMTPVKAGKFNIYNYVADDNIRPQMNGVFHDEGFKVASNSHILMALKDEYPKEYEGSVLYKDGSFYEVEETVWDEDKKGSVSVKHRTGWTDNNGNSHRVFPRWRDVLPRDNEGYVEYKLTPEQREKFYKWIEERRVAHKAETGKGIKWDHNWRLVFNGVGFKVVFFNMLIEAMDRLGTDGIWLRDRRRCAMVKSDAGTCILMPIMLNDDETYETNENWVVL